MQSPQIRMDIDRSGSTPLRLDPFPNGTTRYCCVHCTQELQSIPIVGAVTHRCPCGQRYYAIDTLNAYLARLHQLSQPPLHLVRTGQAA